MGKVKLFVMDVDGTLTDGKIYMGSAGELAKAFNIKDGAGIALLLPKLGMIPVIITARKSEILERRCKELKITELYQDSKDKLEILKGILEKYGSDMNSVAYAGDDLADLPCIREVKRNGGIVVCPSDAIPEIRAMADYVSGYKAGNGAIRDCISYLSLIDGEDSINADDRIRQVVDWIIAGDYRDGTFPDGSKYVIKEYETRPEEECILESHHNHIDVQYVVEGSEELIVYSPESLLSTGVYDKANDSEFWQNGLSVSRSVLVPGSVMVINANQPHKGAIIHGQVEIVKKLVCKISVNEYRKGS